MNRAAIEDESIAIKNNVSAVEIDPSQDHRVRRGAADLKIGRAANAQGSAHKIHIACGMQSNVELHVLSKTLRWRQGHATGKLIDEACQIERRGEREVCERD